MAEKNTPELWDQVWVEAPSVEKDNYARVKEEKSIRWQRIEAAITRDFGGFKGLKVIEIGAGSGTYAALMAGRGAEVTIMDYSANALKQSEAYLRRNGLAAALVRQDGTDSVLGPEMKSTGEVMGVAHDFRSAYGKSQLAIDYSLPREGAAFISVPNKYNPPYRLYKFAAELTGKWKVGEEYPYTRGELERFCRDAGITQFEIFGDSLAGSFSLIDPFSVARKLFKLKPATDVSGIRKERGCRLDKYLSYALVLYGRKPGRLPG